MIVPAELCTDQEIENYFRTLFNRPEIQKELHRWNESVDLARLVEITRTLQNSPEGLAVFYQHNYVLVGNLHAFVAPSFYNGTRYASELSVGTTPCAPVRTVLHLHKELRRWAKEMECKYTQVSSGPYTPTTYGRVLTKLGYDKLGETYVRGV